MSQTKKKCYLILYHQKTYSQKMPINTHCHIDHVFGNNFVMKVGILNYLHIKKKKNY